MKIVSLGELAHRPTNGPLPAGMGVYCPSCMSDLEVTEEEKGVGPFNYRDRGYLYLIWKVKCPQCGRVIWVREDYVRNFLIAQKNQKEEAEKRVSRKRWWSK